MTREEAMGYLFGLYIVAHDGNEYEHGLNKALNMAIEALQAEPTKAVPPSLADVYKWERDVALSQLEEYGIGFAEKKRDDLLEVVRCKDCRHRFYDKYNDCFMCDRHEYGESFEDDDFCSWGERRE